MSWTPEELQLLRETPGFMEIDFMGKTRPWLLCQYAFEQAEEQGVKTEDIIGTSKNGQGDAAYGMKVAALQVWAGFLTFPENEGLSLNMVKAGMSVSEATRLSTVLSEPYKELVEPNGEGKARGR